MWFVTTMIYLSFFSMVLPSQCPKCGAISVKITTVPPDADKRGGNWRTRAECQDCEQYSEWGGRIPAE